MNLSGTMSIEIGGNLSDVTMEQTQTTTVKTSDENPILKKSPSISMSVRYRPHLSAKCVDWRPSLAAMLTQTRILVSILAATFWPFPHSAFSPEISPCNGAGSAG
jgi:hypothetical protein